ncbi:amidohydrolase family protein [bacterium]|nr:amidohydrolase family protein [bacterium]
MGNLFIRDALLADPGIPPVKGCCRIVDGVVSETGKLHPQPQEEVLEGRGLHLIPTLVDAHIHLRVPGGESLETMDSGCGALWNGGVTTVLVMPNTTPPLEDPDLVSQQSQIGKDYGIDIYVAPVCTALRKGEDVSPHIQGNLSRGVRFFTDDGDSVPTQILPKVLDALGSKGIHFCHSEEPQLTSGGPLHLPEGCVGGEGQGWPREGEDVMVSRDIEWGEKKGVWTHLTHLSSKNAVGMVREAKARGSRVSADTTYHHLLVGQRDVSENPVRWKVNPPIREQDDQDALWEGLVDGTIDALVTDHAPHGRRKEGATLEEAPFGLSSADLTFSLLSTLAHKRGIPFWRLLPWATTQPSELLGQNGGRILPGMRANLLLVDPIESWIPAEEDLLSKGRNVPWLGWTLTGRIKARIRQGSLVGRGGELL